MYIVCTNAATIKHNGKVTYSLQYRKWNMSLVCMYVCVNNLKLNLCLLLLVWKFLSTMFDFHAILFHLVIYDGVSIYIHTLTVRIVNWHVLVLIPMIRSSGFLRQVDYLFPLLPTLEHSHPQLYIQYMYVCMYVCTVCMHCKHVRRYIIHMWNGDGVCVSVWK